MRKINLTAHLLGDFQKANTREKQLSTIMNRQARARFPCLYIKNRSYCLVVRLL